MNRARRWIVTKLLAGCLAAAATPAFALQNAPSDPSIELAQRDVRQLLQTLHSRSSTREQREEAARRLVQRDTPESRQVVLTVLRNFGDSSAQLAMARALIADPTPDPALIDALFALLDIDREITPAAARALANYKQNPDVLRRLIDIGQGRHKPDWVRVPVVRAIGSLVDKRAAEMLIRTLRNEEESPPVRAAAADGLIELTGLAENERDVQRWEQWWAANVNRNDADFRNHLLANRVAPLDQLRQRHVALIDSMERLLADFYRQAGDPNNPDAMREAKRQVLLKYLSYPEPEVRTVGARLVYEDKMQGVAPATGVLDQLLQLVGDSSVSVRLEVARTLGVLNETAALEPLLAQLAQEAQPNVRAMIASALGGIRDLRAVPELTKLLNDPSNAVARAAADALRELGQPLREANPQLATATAQQLRTVLETRATRNNAPELREAVVEAMVPLRQADLVVTFNALLHPRESLRVRRSALKGLGAIADANRTDIDTILRLMADNDRALRLEAVNALQTMATIEHAEHLRRRADPVEEQDESVRKAAWNVFLSLLPQMEAQQLQAFADRFMQQPERRRVLLMQLRDVLMRDNRQPEQLASTQENIADVLIQLNRPDEAAAYYKQALDFRREETSVAKERIVRKRVEALLRAKQYADAARFAAEMIALRGEYHETMGQAMQSEAHRLVHQAASPQDALALIDEVKKMQPPLAGRYVTQLSRYEEEARRIIAGNESPPSEAPRPAPQSPRSAAGPLITSILD